MKNGFERLILPTSVAMLLAGCASETGPYWQSDDVSISIQESNDSEITERLKKAADIAGQLTSEFVCEGDFRFSSIDSLDSSPEGSHGEIGAAVTDVLSGTITYSDTLLKQGSDEQLKNVTSHETAHLCAGEERELDMPIDVGDGQFLRYAIGFGLSTHEAGAEDFYTFNSLEEGFATLVGDFRTDGFKSDTPYYSFVGQRFSELLEFGDMSIREAQRFHANSDIDGFFAAILGKEVTVLTNADRLQVLGGFEYTVD